MVKCPWCGEEQGKNLARHLEGQKKGCFFKNILGMTRETFEELKKNLPPQVLEKDRDEIDVKEVKFLKLKRYVTESYHKIKEIYEMVAEESGKTPIEKIQELHIETSTKRNYILEFNLYNKWLKKFNKIIGVESANSYLSTLKCKNSTLKNKISILQTVLKVIIDPTVKLNQLKMNVEYKKKAVLDEEEITNYLEEQEKISFHDYFIQKLMSMYGLRIGSIAALKLQHCLLENKNGPKIILPDIKGKKIREEVVDSDLVNEMKKYFKNENIIDSNEYLFFREGKDLDVRKRANLLDVIINKKIKSSKVLNFNPNYQYTSHMFRKTVAFTSYQNGVELGKQNARVKIGQAKNSSAINHYI